MLFGFANHALADFYGARHAALSDLERAALMVDVAGLMDEESLSAVDAVRVLDQRIGNALESYATVVVAGLGHDEV